MYAAEQIFSPTFPLLVANQTIAFKLPKGMRGRLKDVAVTVTTTYNAVTTPAKIDMGVSGALTAYLNGLSLGTAAAGTAIQATQDQPTTLVDIEMGQDVTHLITFTGNTGGTPAGAAYVTPIVIFY